MTHKTQLRTTKVSQKVTMLGAALSLLIPAAFGGCGGDSKPKTPPITVTIGAMLPTTGPNANSDWISAVELAVTDMTSAVNMSTIKQPVAFNVEEKNVASDETMAHDAMTAYSQDGAKIVITEASNAAIGSNKWNYEQIDTVATGGTPLGAPMPVISFTATSSSLDFPTATDPVPARQEALRDTANWFYRTCPVSNNLSQIRLNEIFGGLVPGTNGDVNGDGVVKVVWIGSLDTSTQSSITGDIKAVMNYLGTPDGIAAIGKKTFVSENVSFDPGADPTSFDYSTYIAQATDNMNQQTGMVDYYPDLIINKALPNIAIPFIKAYKQNPAATYQIFQDGSFRRNTLLVALGTAADGQIGVSNIAYMGDSSGTVFAAEQSAKTGFQPAAYESQGYDAMALALLAVIKASVDNDITDPSALTPDMVHTALDQLNTPGADVPFGTGAAQFALAINAIQNKQSVNYNGASGNVDFDTSDPMTGPAGDTRDYATLWTIQGGQFHETQYFDCVTSNTCAQLPDTLPTM